MKRDNLVRLYVFTLILVITGLFFGQFIVQNAIENKYDTLLVMLSQKQATWSESISKNAALINIDRIKNHESNFNRAQENMSNAIEQLVEVRKAITKGNTALGLPRVTNSTYILKIIEQSARGYAEIIEAGKEITEINFDDPQAERNLILSRSLTNILSEQQAFTRLSNTLANAYQAEAKEHNEGFSNFQYSLLTAIVAVLLIQALFVFRPTVKLVYQNFLTANDAFLKLKTSADKQGEINEQLTISQKELELRNKRLKLSEQDILKSSRKQMVANKKLMQVQTELRKAFLRVKYSEERMRKIAEEQLAATKQLMITETKLKQALSIEKKSKEHLSETLDNLKSTQSQLVQSEKMASLGQLTAGIAHEINNPINFVYNGIDALKASLDDLIIILDKYNELDTTSDMPSTLLEIHELKVEYEYEDLLNDMQELVSDIKKGAVRTIEIVKGLRVFSRLDEEEMKLANVNEALDATLILLRNKTKNIINIKKFYDESMEEINCYPGQLNQVFMNIINNGIQAIPKDKKTGEIQIYTENQDQHVLIKIKDNGTGMSEQVKRRIFEPFFTTKAVGIGTGLGMSITFGIIEKHNGNIYCNSEEGKGTEFSISVPKHINKSNVVEKVSASHNA